MERFECESCQLGKCHRATSFVRYSPFELFYSDIWGLCRIISTNLYLLMSFLEFPGCICLKTKLMCQLLFEIFLPK